MFNIKYLEYFIVSADMGSFSKAAAILYTTQSNVSKGVRIPDGPSMATRMVFMANPPQFISRSSFTAAKQILFTAVPSPESIYQSLNYYKANILYSLLLFQESLFENMAENICKAIEPYT